MRLGVTHVIIVGQVRVVLFKLGLLFGSFALPIDVLEHLAFSFVVKTTIS